MIRQKIECFFLAQDKNKYVVEKLFQMQFTMLKSVSYAPYRNVWYKCEKNNFFDNCMIMSKLPLYASIWM